LLKTTREAEDGCDLTRYVSTNERCRAQHPGVVCTQRNRSRRAATPRFAERTDHGIRAAGEAHTFLDELGQAELEGSAPSPFFRRATLSESLSAHRTS